MTECPKCRSNVIIRNARVMDRGHGNADAGALSLVLYEDPEALIFKGRHTFSLTAHICGACGFTEFYVSDPGALRAASQEFPQQ